MSDYAENVFDMKYTQVQQMCHVSLLALVHPFLCKIYGQYAGIFVFLFMQGAGYMQGWVI